MRKMIPALLSVLVLSGCASLLTSNSEPQAIYSLKEARDITALNSSTSGLSHVLEIQRPVLPPGFDTARIAMYLENGRRMDYYADAKWASPLDEVLQEFTLQTARKTFPQAIVAVSGQALDADYRLQIKVNEFQPVYSGVAETAPLIVASLSFTLLAMPEERIVTSFTIEQQEAAQANTLGSITAGLERLLQSVEARAFETISGRISGKAARSNPAL